MEPVDHTDINDLVLLCEKDFGILPQSGMDFTNFQSVIAWLEKEIQHLLNSDLQSLLNILYRIDISEDATKKVLSAADPSRMAHDLTELVVKRELQKVHTRKKYRK